MVKCRVGPGRHECGGQKGFGVSADNENDPGDGACGEGRNLESGIGLCAGRRAGVLLVGGHVDNELNYVTDFHDGCSLGKHGGLDSSKC